MNYALIVAGGNGSRMNASIPKQFLLLNEKPILYHTIKAFQHFSQNLNIIVVLPKAFLTQENYILSLSDDASNITFIEGGENRFESVKNGLNAIPDNDGIVFIHDGVRPFITNALIEKCLQTAIEKGNAIPCIDVKDSLRKVTNLHNKIINRAEIKAIQTPQTFQISLIKKAYQQPYNTLFTDDASVLETIGENINLVEGLEHNMKITTPFDLQMAAIILNNK